MFKENGNSLEIFNTYNYNQHTVTIESTEGFFQVLDGNLKYNSNGYYTIEVSWIKQFEDINQFKLRIYIKNTSYISNNSFISQRKFTKDPFDTVILINDLVLENSNTEGYYRAVLSIQNKKNTNWTSIINSTPILINNNQNNTLTSTSCIKIKDDNASFLIYEFKTDNNLLIFIDYNKKTSLSDFLSTINNLMLAVGFFIFINFSNIGKMILKDSNIDFNKPFLISSHPNKGIIKQNMNELIPSYSTILNNVQNDIEYETMIKYWHKIPTENIFNLY